MNIPERFWKTATALAGILIALAAVLIVKDLKSISYVGANTNQTNSITVNGTGDAMAVPDIATFSFTVSATAKTVADAQSAATTQNSAAIQALKNGGVAEKDIQTTSYDINPHYENQTATCIYGTICPPSKSVLTGYDVSQTTTVKVRDLSKAGDLFAAIGNLGVQSVYGFSFSVDNPDAVNAQARSKAIADAQSKANELARELGVHLVRIVSFTEDNGSTPTTYPMANFKAMAVAGAPTPEVNPGQQKVTDNVQITYEIQ